MIDGDLRGADVEIKTIVPNVFTKTLIAIAQINQSKKKNNNTITFVKKEQL